jgi:hypothetical protein
MVGDLGEAIRVAHAYNRAGESDDRGGPAVRSYDEIQAMPDDQRLRKLAVAQVALGLVAGALAPIRLPDPLGLARLLPPFGVQRILIVPLFSLAMGQAVLIALWGVASRSSPWRRLVGLVAGSAYLEALLALGLDGEFLGTATVTIAVTTASLLVVRALDVRLDRVTEDGRTGRGGPDGLRFSIRGLMAFTAAVALLSAGARTLKESRGGFIFLAAVWALCFVAVGLVALWAALGEARPRRRVPVVFALSPVLGGFFAHASEAHQAGQFYILTTMLLYPAVLLGSLVVVRSCEYRLIGRSMPSPERPPGGRDDGWPGTGPVI